MKLDFNVTKESIKDRRTIGIYVGIIDEFIKSGNDIAKVVRDDSVTVKQLYQAMRSYVARHDSQIKIFVRSGEVYISKK